MEIIDIFDKFGFPIGVSLVLFVCIYKMFSNELKRTDETTKQVFKVYSDQISFAEKQIEKLTAVINENTKAYTSLIDVIKELKNIMK